MISKEVVSSPILSTFQNYLVKNSLLPLLAILFLFSCNNDSPKPETTKKDSAEVRFPEILTTADSIDQGILKIADTIKGSPFQRENSPERRSRSISSTGGFRTNRCRLCKRTACLQGLSVAEYRAMEPEIVALYHFSHRV